MLICGIDEPNAESWLRQSFPSHIRLENQRRVAIDHPLSQLAIEDCRLSAEALLSFYTSHVSLVFTSLMHCASPCASIGVPTVIIRRDPENLRFSDIREHLTILASERLAAGEFKAEDLRKRAATLDRRLSMLNMLALALEQFAEN